MQHVIVVHLEYLGDEPGTYRVSFTGVAIDYHSHGAPPFTEPCVCPAQYSHDLGQEQLGQQRGILPHGDAV